MYVLAISTVTDHDGFWGSLRNLYTVLPPGAAWVLAVASADGTRGVNVIAHDSVEGVRALFDSHAGPYGVTECFEADAANAVGLAT